MMEVDLGTAIKAVMKKSFAQFSSTVPLYGSRLDARIPFRKNCSLMSWIFLRVTVATICNSEAAIGLCGNLNIVGSRFIQVSNELLW
jgi:hypothetical protein